MKPIEFDDEETTGFPVADSKDHAILMHRDAHFGGNFDFMLKYYASGGKGMSPAFDIEQIQALAEVEKKAQANLASLMLSGPEAERVALAREAYKKLRKVYETHVKISENARLIADLILSEEEHPQAEIDAIANKKEAIVPLLIDLLRSEDFSDPLFPGYGFAPSLAAECLGKIGDKRAIISLFESIGAFDYFDEEIALSALKKIGEPAKAFLLKVLQGKPINEDNERAAIALIPFKDDEEVAKTCLKMLQDPDFKKDLALSTYLVLACEGLKSQADKDLFKTLSNDKSLPKELLQDMATISKLWK